MVPPTLLHPSRVPITARPWYYQLPRTSKQRLTFFERGWTDFPLGVLPLALLARLSRYLVALAVSLRACHLPPFYLGDQSPLVNRASLRYGLDSLQTASRSDLEGYLRKEAEDLLCIMLSAPLRKTNPHLHRELLLSAMRRLGQVYGVCKKRWTAREARAMVLAQAERLWVEWQHCYHLLLLTNPIMARLLIARLQRERNARR
jgi:hypothetical protein